MVLFLSNKRVNFMLFRADYYLRWGRLPIEERACRKTDLGGGDYYLRNSGLPPSLSKGAQLSVLLLSFRGVIMNLSRGRHSAVVYVKWTQWWVLLLSFRGVIRNFSRGRGGVQLQFGAKYTPGNHYAHLRGGQSPLSVYAPAKVPK